MHLGIYWPDGLRQILKAGADPDLADNNGRTPIFYAVTFCLPESFNILAGTRCLFCTSKSTAVSFCMLKSLNLLATYQSKPESLLSAIIYRGLCINTFRPEALEEEFEDILRTTTRIVVERRRIMETLVRTTLGKMAAKQLRLSPESVLDRSASHAISMLRGKIEVPNYLSYLTFEYGTVYHIRYLALREAQIFWNAGFREIDELDEWSLSPLMRRASRFYYTEMLDLIVWLIANGANIHHQPHFAFSIQIVKDDYTPINTSWPEITNKPSSTTALHYLASHLAWVIEGVVDRSDGENIIRAMKPLSKLTRALIRHVLTDALPDGCNCACSTTGCTAYTMMVKHWSGPWQTGRKDHAWVMKKLAKVLNIDGSNLGWLRTEMIRFNTFEQLNLRHTCCSMEYSVQVRMYVICETCDEEESQEVQEEQVEQVERLETLLVEFEAKYEESNCSFSEFMNGYWKKRIREVLSMESPIDHDALADMNVVLERTDGHMSSQSSVGEVEELGDSESEESDISEDSADFEDLEDFEDYLAKYRMP